MDRQAEGWARHPSVCLHTFAAGARHGWATGCAQHQHRSSANANPQTTALSFAEMDELVAGRLADRTQRKHHGSAKLKLQAKSASSPCAACASSSFFDSKIDMLHAGRDAIFQGGSTSGRFFCAPKGCNGTAWIVQCAVQYPTMCTLTLV